MTESLGYYTPRPYPKMYTPGFSRAFPPYVVKCVMCGRKGHTKLWPPTWLSDGPYVAPPEGWLGFEDCGECPPSLRRMILYKVLEVLATVFLGALVLLLLGWAYDLGLSRMGLRP